MKKKKLNKISKYKNVLKIVRSSKCIEKYPLSAFKRMFCEMELLTVKSINRQTGAKPEQNLCTEFTKNDTLTLHTALYRSSAIHEKICRCITVLRSAAWQTSFSQNKSDTHAAFSSCHIFNTL